MGKQKDLLSVIVPVYKVEPYLRRCIDSILGQTYKNLQVILVDDGSPDRSERICSFLQQNIARYRYFISQFVLTNDNVNISFINALIFLGVIFDVNAS